MSEASAILSTSVFGYFGWILRIPSNWELAELAELAFKEAHVQIHPQAPPNLQNYGRSRLQPVQSVCSFTWTTERHGKFKKDYLDLANRNPQSQGVSAFFSHDIVWYILISSLAEKWRQAKMFWNGLGPEIWWDLMRSGSSFLVQNRQWLLCATAANVNAMSDVNQVGCQIF